MEFAIAFIGVTLARAVAAPLNSNYLEVGLLQYLQKVSNPIVKHTITIKEVWLAFRALCMYGI